MRVLHILDHSVPVQSGYTFRTRAILEQQRCLGWETLHLTSTKHDGACTGEEDVDGLQAATAKLMTEVSVMRSRKSLPPARRKLSEFWTADNIKIVLLILLTAIAIAAGVSIPLTP